jgi:predicted aminopeptidase
VGVCLIVALALAWRSELDYYLHLATGQMGLIVGCESVAQVLSSPALENRTRERLLFSGAILEFAHKELGLGGASNYTCYYDTDGQPVSWNISASPPHRFAPYQWWFPIVGSVPYKGYFERERAEAERDRLSAEGYDVIVRAVSAYSTLGFLSDPLLSTMIRYREGEFADLILHELTHATVYAPGQTEFNESLATFVGKTGSLLFMQRHYGAGSDVVAATRRQRQEGERFATLMHAVTSALDSLYALDLSREEVLLQRVAVFDGFKERYRGMKELFPSSRYDGFLSWEVNNARLLSYRRYHRSLDLFANIYHQCGDSLQVALSVFASCEDAADPWQCLRSVEDQDLYGASNGSGS